MVKPAGQEVQLAVPVLAAWVDTGQGTQNWAPEALWLLPIAQGVQAVVGRL